mmetsp:Transcript_21146/g.45854  ORF Transcript_21146/g.45854 Transcript_21146/m.45854 type:complete len:261 (+) Transcript_21146:272-1054(+)
MEEQRCLPHLPLPLSAIEYVGIRCTASLRDLNGLLLSFIKNLQGCLCSGGVAQPLHDRPHERCEWRVLSYADAPQMLQRLCQPFPLKRFGQVFPEISSFFALLEPHILASWRLNRRMIILGRLSERGIPQVMGPIVAVRRCRKYELADLIWPNMPHFRLTAGGVGTAQNPRDEKRTPRHRQRIMNLTFPQWPSAGVHHGLRCAELEPKVVPNSIGQLVAPPIHWGRAACEGQEEGYFHERFEPCSFLLTVETASRSHRPL